MDEPGGACDLSQGLWVAVGRIVHDHINDVGAYRALVIGNSAVDYEACVAKALPNGLSRQKVPRSYLGGAIADRLGILL
jgi:hypothetical protein